MREDRFSQAVRCLLGIGARAARTGTAGLAAFFLSIVAVAAQQGSSVREILPGCHAVLEDDATVADRIGSAGRCSGIIEALIVLGRRLPDQQRFCVPRFLAIYEVVRLIVDNLESQYALVENRSFTLAAMEILRIRWSCGAESQ